MSSKHEEHPFKEWLSDNLRYLVLIVCIALGIVAIASGVRVYQSFHRQSAAKDEQSTDQTITIISQGEDESGVTVSRQTVRKEPETGKETAATEKQTETETKKQTEKQTETETKKQTEKQTETETKKQTEKQTETETKKQTEKQTETETKKQTEKQTETETKKQTEKQAETETKKQTEKQTETQKQTEEIDTLKRYSSAATLYADEESNIRSGPGTGYSVIGTAQAGDPLTVTGETDKWYLIRYDGQNAYIAKSLTASSYTPPEPVYRTITSACNVRSDPSYGDNVIVSDLPAGTQVEYLGGSGWCEIKLSDGTVGYVGEKFLE